MKKLKKPWVTPEVRKLKPTRDLLGRFGPDAATWLAVQNEPKK